ncbi:Transcriptional elongation regulator MINIYO [Camellia lanceoleosa]|uniref:Transcriptional elongation regulator MINIYO n=1 Tax=Camellia lanceoleosa TaxID=1840588 RepID=A0ACC0IJ70_9ERIC|nr:Transcriptional elongation regulator MINIYO [Camellia lanceoleosa]
MSPSPFSIQHSPYTSAFATPTFCSSPPPVQSPGRAPQLSSKSSLKGPLCQKLEKPMPAELEKSWSYSGKHSSRRISGDAPEAIKEGNLRKPQNRPILPTSAPRPTVLPFPVARHRSHGPHWAPMGSGNSGGGDDENDAEDEDLTEFDPIVVSANPVQRKEKKSLDLSRWRELMANDNPYVAQKNNNNRYLVVESKKQKKTNELTENSDQTSSRVGAMKGGLPQKMSPDKDANSEDVTMKAMDPELLEEVSQNVIAETRGEVMEPGSLEVSKRQRRVDTEKQKVSTSHKTASHTSINMENEEESTSLESQIDAENRAQLQRMSADEIAEAQAEILEKMNPAVIEALRKRGQHKLKKERVSSLDMAAKGEVGNLQDEKKLIKDAKCSPLSERDISRNELRFSLDGNVVENNFMEVPKTGNLSTESGYSSNNVSERDFLRTEGDPAAAGYTVKEAVALTRSVVPGQRSLALHLLASVLDKALHNICQNQVGLNVKNAGANNFIDWAAVWAYALGPEPELALSLRMSLDDNHNSVVLACAKVIQCVLSCDINENYFDISEKIAAYSKDPFTAPVLRSRLAIDVGFFQGGYWKYNAKPSNILPFGEHIVNDNNEEGEHTIQDDMVVAGQDFVAGLVRMGILPRICYLWSVLHVLIDTSVIRNIKNPSAALEESIISILIAIAKHSPTCAKAIMNSERLVQTVVDRFTTKEPMEVNPSKIKSTPF